MQSRHIGRFPRVPNSMLLRGAHRGGIVDGYLTLVLGEGLGKLCALAAFPYLGAGARPEKTPPSAVPPQAGETALPENLRPRGYCTLEARGVQVKMCLR
jgi:hypothetical protein